jgi:alkylation response protein AidB-like acyl-CoA dehydrogenase
MSYFPFTTSAHDALRERAAEFAQTVVRPRAAAIDESAVHPTELVRLAAQEGLVGPMIGKEYGGSGLDLMSAVIIAEELTGAAASVGVCVSGASLGSEMVEVFGTDAQKSEYLPRVAAGEALSGIAITEPNAGSDVGALETEAKREGDGFCINGRKIFISNGTVGEWIIVLAKASTRSGRPGSTAFMVPTSTQGYSAKQMATMGWRAHDTAAIALTDVRVGKDAVLGVEGEGFEQAQYFLDRSRVVAAANALGFAIGAMKLSVNYARERVQFGKSLTEQQAIRFAIADMESRVRQIRLCVYSAAFEVDAGSPSTKSSAIAKLVSSELAEEVVSQAFQLFGGYAYFPEYEIERFYRDVRIMRIVEGTSEIQRHIIAREALGGR